MTRDPIYLDHNASTPVVPRVRAAILDALERGFGNPSAGHVYGRRAREIVERARAEVAALIGCDADEIVFVSGGTEANNAALRGFAPAGTGTLIVSAVEHPATSEPARALERAGTSVTTLAVNGEGLVDPASVARALDGGAGRPALVSILFAQNETGVIQPIADIARAARDRGALVHTDAAQAVGKIPVDVRALGVDMLAIAGHKLYAPKGVGALYVRRGVTLAALLGGAGHERGLRPGTENVAGVAGLGEACAMAREDLAREAARQQALRDRLESALVRVGFVVHGGGAPRLPNTMNGRFPAVRGSALLAATPELAFTTGSACHAGTEQPSSALLAMGIAASDALGAIRLSIGRATTEADVDAAADLLRSRASALRDPPPSPR